MTEPTMFVTLEVKTDATQADILKHYRIFDTTMIEGRDGIVHPMRIIQVQFNTVTNKRPKSKKKITKAK